MPLLEVVQTRQISASIRLTDSTATQVDQYAAFIRACADDVVEQALTYVFSKDRDFQDFQHPLRLLYRRRKAHDPPFHSGAKALRCFAPEEC